MSTFLKEPGLLSNKQVEHSLKHYPRIIPCCSTLVPPQQPSYFLCFHLKCSKSPLLRLIHILPLPNFKTPMSSGKSSLGNCTWFSSETCGHFGARPVFHDSQCATVGSNRTHLVGVVVGIERVNMCGQCLELKRAP